MYNPQVQMLLASEFRRVDASINSAMSRMCTARTIRDVVSIMDVPIPPLLRSMRHEIRNLRDVKRVAMARAQILIANHLSDLKATENHDACLKLLGRFRRIEWDLLRGELSQLYSGTIRAAEAILREKKLAEDS